MSASEVARRFPIAHRGRVIISSVTNPDGTGPEVGWQRSARAASAPPATSGPRAPPLLPGTFEVRAGETAIISEVFFDFVPLLSELVVGPQTVYRQALHRPRLGTLEQIEP